MRLNFSKYQGTGNDFIIIDGMKEEVVLSNEQVAKLCDRKFGIGADGLMIMTPSAKADFKMVYYNSDGNQSTMCGNGGRCITSFANRNGYIEDKTSFEAIDGLHKAKILDDSIVELEMIDVASVECSDPVYILNTGSPHYIKFKSEVDIDIYEFGREVRYGQRFEEEGINVNLIKKTQDGISIQTYERGVEDETLSCGTGVTAAAIAYAIQANLDGKQNISVKAVGGNLYVKLNRTGIQSFENIWLCGPATFVFEGHFNL